MSWPPWLAGSASHLPPLRPSIQPRAHPPHPVRGLAVRNLALGRHRPCGREGVAELPLAWPGFVSPCCPAFTSRHVLLDADRTLTFRYARPGEPPRWLRCRARQTVYHIRRWERPRQPCGLVSGEGVVVRPNACWVCTLITPFAHPHAALSLP